jgi:molecular chaperone GrpE
MGKKKKGSNGEGERSTEGKIKISKSEKSKDNIKLIVEQLKEKERLLSECKDQLLRLQAEFENYKKQLDKEKEEFMLNANESLIKDLLIVLDDFERAIKEIKKHRGGDKKLIDGFELIYKNFFKILEQRGLKRIDALGKKFDPYYHEALLQAHSEEEEGTILEEFQKGYLLNNKVIRHSKVKISKKK